MPERVAVIIPVYNHARYVGEALESVLAQTRKPDRIIVLDDGSKDNSLEVLRGFASRGVEVSGQENRGAHNTINLLVQKAAVDCDWISILNSDDRYLPGRIAACLEAASRQPDKALITTSLQVMDDQGALLPKDAPRSRWFHGAWSLGEKDGVSISEWLGQANFVATTSNVFAQAAYLKANPFRPYRFNHDYFFLATAAFEDQIAVVPQPLMDYRVHGSNTIATKPEPLIREMIRMHLDLYQKHAEALKQNPEMRKRFYGFVRGSWDNISSFHAGLCQVALAQLAAKASEDEIEQLVASLTGAELDEFPNRILAGAYNGTDALSAAGVLSRQVDDLKAANAGLKQDREALEKLSRCRQKILTSSWVRLGLLCGAARELTSNDGKKPVDKLEALTQACHQSWWLKLGEKLGSSSSRELRQQS